MELRKFQRRSGLDRRQEQRSISHLVDRRRLPNWDRRTGDRRTRENLTVSPHKLGNLHGVTYLVLHQRL